jgi:hypothetical protein
MCAGRRDSELLHAQKMAPIFRIYEGINTKLMSLSMIAYVRTKSKQHNVRCGNRSARGPKHRCDKLFTTADEYNAAIVGTLLCAEWPRDTWAG